jgi:hypothetical protein
MLKNLFTFFLIIALSHTYAADPFYSQAVYAETNDNRHYIESVKDLVEYLGKITGKNFSQKNFTSQSSAGVFVLLNKPGVLTSELDQRLSKGSTEDFVISGNNYRIIITANHPIGLSRGIYGYLDQLGVRWYLPGARWEYVEKKSSIIFSGSQYYSPSLFSRDFFGTGGIQPVQPIDPDSKVNKEWVDWKRRNRMGSDVDLGGHYGELFNTNHKQDLLNHPEYLALVNGKREWSITTKWCVTNKDFQKLFIEDRELEMEQALKTDKYPSKKIVLSVDPSDGGGDCECDNCKKLGSVSNRYFFLANEVAKAFAKISPRAYVNLLGYNTHAAPPTFPLEPNIIVMIVPYAFHNFGTPDQMIDAWGKKNTNLVIYDYYYIPDWAYEVPMPDRISASKLSEKIKAWSKKGIKGYHFESVFGTGVAGLGLYSAARLGWDDNTNIAELRKKFVKDMFGAAENEIGKYYEYIGEHYVDVSGTSYLRSLITAAQAKTSDAGVRSRLSDLQAYLHYLVLFSQWQASGNLKGQECENLIKYVWEIYPRMVVHSTRIAQLFSYKLEGTDALAKDWSLWEPYGQKLMAVRFLDDKAIQQIHEQDSKQFPALEGFPYYRQKPFNYQLKAPKASPKYEGHIIPYNYIPKTLIQPNADGKVNFSVKLNDNVDHNAETLTIKCIDTLTNKVVLTKKEEITKQLKTISFNLPVNKTYRLMLEYKSLIRLYVPPDLWMAFTEITPYAVMDKLWFYVPAKTPYIYYSIEEVDQPVFTRLDGKISPVEKLNGQRLHRVATNSDNGEWWCISSSHYKVLTFYSLPDLFFAHPSFTPALQ